ncbi:MAG TPA: hypothetical protein VHS32_15030, partial [Streptosporangiaceae bacterium]|nr:hypothetical protein [Streptosporangiaceae bacterium]
LIRWWAKHQGRFDDHTRYLGGQPITFEILQQALIDAPMRRRHAIAAELAIRTDGRHQVQTRHFTAVQRRQMNDLARLPRTAFSGTYARKLARAGRQG